MAKAKAEEPCSCPACAPTTLTARLYPTDYEHVPRLAELARRGLAKPVGPSHFRATPEGERVILDATKRNAARAVAMAG